MSANVFNIFPVPTPQAKSLLVFMILTSVKRCCIVLLLCHFFFNRGELRSRVAELNGIIYATRIHFYSLAKNSLIIFFFLVLKKKKIIRLIIFASTPC